MPNHLAGQTSPYLLQHVDNPVDWYPWGEEALAKASREDLPIFLSIGYSACHWCHVMERESFTDEETAALLNQHFVAVKVDREERPDLDTIYMEAVSLLTGRGGWPLNVWLTPQGAPFYGGTYFPDRARYGMPSFKEVLRAIAAAWKERREDLERAATSVVEHLEQNAGGSAPHEAEASTPSTVDALRSVQTGAPEDALDQTLHRQARRALESTFDPVYGGWGEAPKFPQPVLLEYLLASHALGPDARLWAQIEQTLDAMAHGGMYDQMGGGFHRYSTDDRWLVPHFEKMLYDNAQLARCYLHAWQLSGKERYKRVACETLDYLLRDMRHASGGFYSAEDADSEGEEGTFYLWTLQEIDAALPSEEAAVVHHVYGPTAEGDFEGRNILHVVSEPEGARAAAMLAAARARLFALREERTRPGLDDKIIASWNGLALAAFADAARILHSEKYQQAALACGSFLCEHLVHAGGRMSHTWKDGRPSENGFLEDHALVAEGLLALYQATFAERWFVSACDLLSVVPDLFGRDEGGFYDTSIAHESLITRPRSLMDSPLPSGNAAATLGLLKLAAFTGDSTYTRLVEEALATRSELSSRAPSMFAHWLMAHLLAHEGLAQLAVVGDPQADDSRRLLEVVDQTYRPNLVVALRPPGSATAIPLLEGREPSVPVTASANDHPTAQPRATAWLCRRSTCAPATDRPETLRALLDDA